MSTGLTVSFHGHQHTLIEHGGEPHVAMRPVVEAIGLAWSSQMQRIKAHPVMGTCVLITNTQMPGDDQRREIFALPLKYLNGWLFGVDSRRVKAELRDTLIAYQRECFDVLDRHWRGVQCPAPMDDGPSLPASVGHRADHIVAASRIFRSLVRAAQDVRLPRHRVLACANEAALAATGYDMVAELGIEDQLESSPLAVEADGSCDPWLEPVARYLNENKPDRVTTGEILLKALHLNAQQQDRSAQTRIGHVLKKLGWQPRQKRLPGSGTKQREYCRVH